MNENLRRTGLGIWIAILALSTSACVVVDDGEVGVSKSFGSINEEPVGQGVTFVLPVARQLETWNIKLQEIKEKATLPSSEGLIVGLDVSLLFQVDAESAPKIRRTIGRDYMSLLVVPYFRNALRDVVSGYEVRSIYSEVGRKEIASKVKDFLQETLAPRGIQIVDVLLRDVQLPQRFRESIEAKLTAQQRVQQKQFELEQARKEAEIEVARAEGAAQAQRIIRETLSDSYLQYLWIQTLNDNPNVIYVATEANLPIFKGVGGAVK
jgi:regulator of protease activity HflC (stomatin/prohibitin superfamily)